MASCNKHHVWFSLGSFFQMLPFATRFLCYLNTFLTWIFNGLLIILIVQRSPKTMANYKYLMLSFAVCSVFFGFVNITNQPFLHFYKKTYIVFSENLLGLPRWLAFWYLAVNCSCFIMKLGLIALHFIYRYLAVCKPHLVYLFSWPYCNIFIGASLFTTIGWCIFSTFLAGDSENTDQYIGATMLQDFGLQKDDFVYSATMLIKTDPITLTKYLSIPDLVFNIVVGVIFGIIFFTMIFCWLKIRRELINAVNYHRKVSRKTLEMQKKLFNCLVVQTLIPLFCMITPTFITVILPAFGLDLRIFESVCFSLANSQAYLDAIVPMFFIPDYRKAIRRFFGEKLPNSNVVSVVTTHEN